MDMNDTIGCCGVAGMEHAQKLWVANSVDKVFRNTDQDVVRVYSDLSGYDPKTGQNDNGIALLSGLKYWQKTGYNDHKIDAYFLVDAKNGDKVRAALYLFGCLYAGIALPDTFEAQTDAGKPWDVVNPSLTGDSAPWSAGGHCVLLTAWGENYKCITWGQEQEITPRFLGTYADELWACLSLDWFTAQHLTPTGFKYSELMADSKAVRSA